MSLRDRKDQASLYSQTASNSFIKAPFWKGDTTTSLEKIERYFLQLGYVDLDVMVLYLQATIGTAASEALDAIPDFHPSPCQNHSQGRHQAYLKRHSS